MTTTPTHASDDVDPDAKETPVETDSGTPEIRTAKNAVDLVVFEECSDEVPGQGTNGRGTLGLCPPPETGVVSVVFAADVPLSGTTEVESATDDAADDELPKALRLLALVGTDEDPYADEWAYADGENAGGRCFFITQNEVHTSGQVLLTEERINAALDKKGYATGRWAWIRHDKDVYTAEEAKRNPRAVVGAKKDDHFHVAIQRKSHATIGQVARAFGVPPSQVESKPQGAFLDLVEYLTHENPGQQAKGKHVYADEEVRANFDWRPELEDHKLARSFKAGARANTKKLDELMLAVLGGEKTLRDVRAEEPVLYGRNVDKFRRWRQDYMVNREPPSRRVNYYICGGSNSGKSILAELLALGLYPDLDADELIFWAGDPKVAHQGYVGQRVVVYDDYRPGDLIRACGGRTGVWRVFDPHPKPADANVKNGSVRLLQEVNIITGVVPYAEFMEQLAGSYTDERGNEHAAEDDRQSFRRFPFVIEVTPSMVEFYANRGFFGDHERIRQYERFARMKANMREVIARRDALPSDAAREMYDEAIGNRLFSGMVARHREVVAPPRVITAEEAIAELEATTLIQNADVLALEEIEQLESVTAAAEIEAEEEAAVTEVLACLDPATDEPAIRSVERDFARRWGRYHPATDTTILSRGIVPPGH